MKLTIDQNDNLLDSTLIYVAKDYAFNTEPISESIDFEIIVNSLSIVVVDDKATQVWGFCPHSSWIVSNLTLPINVEQGAVVVKDGPTNGYAYSLTQDEEWPVYVDKLNGWVAIGDVENVGNPVRFMRDGIMKIQNGNLISLWLKPKELPQF